MRDLIETWHLGNVTALTFVALLIGKECDVRWLIEGACDYVTWSELIAFEFRVRYSRPHFDFDLR